MENHKYSIKQNSLVKRYEVSLTSLIFSLNTFWPAALHITDEGNCILILKTLCAGVAGAQAGYTSLCVGSGVGLQKPSAPHV